MSNHDSSATFQISQNTLAVLKNFTKINSKMLIQPGSQILVKKDTDDVYAFYACPEVFPDSVPVYDMNSLLSILLSFTKPNIEIQSNQIVIREEDTQSSVIYRKAAETILMKSALLKFPDLSTFTEKAKFTLTNDQRKKFMDMSGILSYDKIFFAISSSGTISASVKNPDGVGNEYNVTLAQTEQTIDEPLEYQFDIDCFHFIPGNYEILFYVYKGQKFLLAKHSTVDLKYLICAYRGV